MDMPADKKYRETLIKNVKKEVKQIMEEAVTKRFVHEDSSSVTSLCAAVEACLSQGIKRRALGLFKTSSTTALLHKVAKNFEAAAIISKKVQEIEHSDPNRRSSSSSDSIITTRSASHTLSSSASLTRPSLNKKSSSSGGLAQVQLPRYLWIRLALFEKVLAKIIDHLVQNSSKYYEKDALVADPDYGSILSSLLVGPCALDYSKTKTLDQYWNDPPADELVQRHRISSGHTTPPSCRKTPINFRRTLYAVNSEENSRQNPVSAKDYVESLHQNSRATLLYGKNNVLVLPKDMKEPMPGYLSLHQTPISLIIKWTPNELMNGYVDENHDKSQYWDYAMNVNFNDIVYVHCHQQGDDNGGTVILVGQDGVQQPPIHFPRGGHLLAFLSCLENGLLPHGQLDPPLWSQRGKGKVFPKLRRRGRPIRSKGNEPDLEESVDYVFQIINKMSHREFLLEQGLIDPESWSNSAHHMASCVQRAQLSSSSTNSSTSSKSFSLDRMAVNSKDDSGVFYENPVNINKPQKPASGESLNTVCETMKKQILSRAFYGWLAYCRHLKTVRTHLSGLVNVKIMEGEGASEGLTKEIWESLRLDDGTICFEEEIYRRTYYGSIEHEIRKEVWPFLLGHYKFNSTSEEREELDRTTKQYYETTMTEWLAVEAIVRQKDKEIMAANIAKLSSESTSGEPAPLTPGLQNDMSNDVFEDDSIASDGEPPIIDENEQLSPVVEERSIEYNSLENDPRTKDLNVDSESENYQSTSQPVEKSEEERLLEDIQNFVNDSISRCDSPDEGVGEEADSEDEGADVDSAKNTDGRHSKPVTSVIITTNPSQDSGNQSEISNGSRNSCSQMKSFPEDDKEGNDKCLQEGQRSNCISPASSQGGVYSVEILETFGLNVHRIDKDVQRCDRNYWYFTLDNLEKLRNIMCTYIWEHLDIGYMQGMCDLVAPLLVILDDESITYACFCRLMDRLSANFPHSGEAMDMHFANMRSLIQILDPELFELMDKNRDYTHFFFCYRWFLLDFKRELLYDDVFIVWETIWSAKFVSSAHFYLFFALALVETYREIIIGNQMEFTEIIKFFNDMAERHDAKSVLNLARNLVVQLHSLIEDQLSTSSTTSS
ncbi:small G protein signaling modulator 2-like isoform X2 [Planococcus citri]|uniref:small G protein signaling modulator 2-like isoform X2 n=1 Tax=Planococcus citri TaxID=170843 RepID=UPI0031F84BB7